VRTLSTVLKAALLCAVAGVTLTGCGGGTAATEASPEEMLDDANKAMRSLKSVAITIVTEKSSGDRYTAVVQTDLKSKCASTTVSDDGEQLEQIWIGDTHYTRANGEKAQRRWVKMPVDEAEPDSIPSDCTWPFTSFGKVVKGKPAKIGTKPVMRLVATDEKVKGGTYTYYIAAEGKPYLLTVDFKDAEFRTTTSFGAFDEPLDIRPPADAVEPSR